MKGAKITLIRAPSLFARGAITINATPPIGLAYLAGNLRTAGHEVNLIDSVGEAIEQLYYYGRQNLYVNGLSMDEIINTIPDDSKYIGLSFPFSHEWLLYKQLSHEIKNKFPNSILICGGEHATALPDFSLQNSSSIDYCVLGEGEETLKELINVLESNKSVEGVAGLALRDKAGKTIFTAKRKRISDIDSICPPAWDLVPLENYLKGGYSYGVNRGRSIPIIATRGCPYQCTFCSNPQMWHRCWLPRTPLRVIEEMEEYIQKYSIKNFDFYDLTLVLDRKWIIEFCNLLIEKKLNITWQLPSGTRAESLDKEITALLYKSGCRNISYAPESGSQEILHRLKKRVNLDKMIVSMKGAIANSLNTKANIVIGFPGEKLTNIIETLGFVVKMAIVGVHDTSIWTFVAYPGSEMFNDLDKGGKISKLTDDYFISLLSYSDLRRAVSWNEYLSNKALNYIRVLGLMLFYGVSYIVRPARLGRTIINLIRHKPQSRLEMIVGNILRYHKGLTPRQKAPPVKAKDEWGWLGIRSSESRNKRSHGCKAVELHKK